MAETSIYLDEVDPDAIGGFDRVLPGSYCCLIKSVDEHSDQRGKMIVEFEILTGTVPQQVGKLHREWFGKSNSKMDAKKLTALATASGLVTLEKTKAAKSAGTALAIDFQGAANTIVVLNLELNDYNNKTRLAWDEIFHPTDKRVNHVPLHAGMLASHGISLPLTRPVEGIRAAGPATQSSGSKPPTPPKAPPLAGDAGNVDDFLSGVV